MDEEAAERLASAIEKLDERLSQEGSDRKGWLDPDTLFDVVKEMRDLAERIDEKLASIDERLSSIDSQMPSCD